MKNIRLTFKADLSDEKDENEILSYLEVFVKMRVTEWLDGHEKVADIKAEFVRDDEWLEKRNHQKILSN